MKSLSRYGPFTAFLAVLVLILLFVPSVNSGGGSGSGAATGLPPGVTPMPIPGSAGMTVGGVHCAPGVRQLPGSDYAPECVPAWHGDNGGATAPGVTAKTITIDYRQFSSTDLEQLYSFIPKSIIGTNQQAINTIQANLKVFNHYFELYGRKVVLKIFTGKSDIIKEVTGSNLAEAQADAVTAQSLGSFADVSLADTSEFYVTSLAEHHVIAFPLFYQLDAASYLAQEPYVYTPGPDCTKSNSGLAAMIGNSMAGMPAIYAGDAKLRSSTRKFGIFYNDTPYSAACEKALVADLRRVGVKPAVVTSYDFSPTQLTQQITAAVDQMKEKGVTTVIDPDSDPVTPGLLMGLAEANDYHPEWMMMPSFIGGNIDSDAIQRNFAAQAPEEMDHVIMPGIASVPLTRQEDYRVFQEGSPGGDHLPAYSLAWFYAPMMILFSALQMAGPDLTPKTFQDAFHHLTSSKPDGMFGPWKFGPSIADPASGFQILYWNPTAVSNLDGKQGALEACNGATMYSYSSAARQLPRGRQLSCYGRAYPSKAAGG